MGLVYMDYDNRCFELLKRRRENRSIDTVYCASDHMEMDRARESASGDVIFVNDGAGGAGNTLVIRLLVLGFSVRIPNRRHT